MSYKQTLYTEFIGGLETAINSLHGCQVVSIIGKANIFPIVEMRHIGYDLSDETMGKEQQYIEFGYEVNIYAVDTETLLADEIVEDIEEVVIDYFNLKGFTYSTPSVRNSDETVARRLVRVSAVYDENKNIIYRG
jgi:hypothetical protein